MKQLVLLIGLILLVSTTLVAQISAPYTQNFDTMTANQVPSQGWTTIVQNQPALWIINAQANARSVPNFARLSANTTTGTAILISPEVSNLASCNLKFWVRIAQVTPFPNLIVGVMSDNTDPDSFVPVQTINGLNQTYQQVEINLSSHAANGPYIGFKHGANVINKNILIDDVSLELLATGPVFGVSPNSKNYGLIGVGEGFQSQPQDFSISNFGIGNLGITSVSIIGADADDFFISAQPAHYPLILGAGESGTVSVVFSPESIGVKSAVLQIVDDIGRTVNEVPLSGEAYVPPAGAACHDPIIITLPITDQAGELNLPFGNDYASAWVSPASSYLNGIDVVYQFTLSEESYLSGSVAGAGSRTGLFILSDCPDPLDPASVLAKGEGVNGGSFTNVPFAAGTYFAIVSSSLTSSPISYSFSIGAVAAGSPNPVISPLEKDFGQTVLGMEKTQLFTVSNSGGSGMSITSIYLDGLNATDFTLVNPPAEYPADVDFAQQFSFSIGFAPTSEGPKSANLIIIDNLAKSEHSIPLYGIGFKQFEGGNGSVGNPFQINDVDQFNQLREYLGVAHTNVHFIQTADLDLSGSQWLPIGTTASPFYANLDGNGYKIRNLTISRPIVNVAENNNQGLFAATNSASMKNLAIVDASITGYNILGTITGIASSTVIENCYSTGSIAGFGNVGGLVGQSSDSVIKSSYSSANVSGVNSSGGIVGILSSTVNPTIINCYATGTISQTASGTGIGGLVGLAFSGQVHNSFAIGAVNGFGTPSNTWGGLIGNVLGNLSFNSFYNTETSGMTDTTKGLPRTTAEMTFPYAENTYTGWDFDTIWGMDFVGNMNNGYPYLRSFGTTISEGEINIITPESVTLDAGVNASHPVVVALPNYSNLSNIVVFGLNGKGTQDLAVSVGAGNWYGLIYFNGAWHTSNPPLIVGPGYISFIGVDFGAKSDVIIVLSENEDPTLPVELSSFAAVLTADMYVSLSWIVESETNHSGYNVHRNQVLDMNTAIRLNPTLISAGIQNGTQISYKYIDTEIQESSIYYYWLESVDLDGSSRMFGPVSVYADGQNDDNISPELPLRTELLNAYPNPFNPITNIAYVINKPGRVQIGVYNVKGQLIRSFDQHHSQPGYYNQIWDGKDHTGIDAASGVYFYRMNTSDYQATKKMLLAK